MYQMILKMLRANRVRTTVSCVILALLTFISLQGLFVFLGLVKQTSSMMRSAPDVDIWMSIPTAADREQIRISLQEIDGIAYFAPVQKLETSIRIDHDSSLPIQLVGIDTQSYLGAPLVDVRGELEHLNMQRALVVDRSSGLQTKQRVWLQGAEYLIVGSCFAKPGLVSKSTGYLSLDNFQELRGHKEHFFVVKVREGVNPLRLAKRLSRQNHVRCFTSTEVIKFTLEKMLMQHGLSRSFAVVIFCSVLLAMLIASHQIVDHASSMTQTFATFRAMGASHNFLMKISLYQSLTLSLFSYLLGLLILLPMHLVLRNTLLAFSLDIEVILLSALGMSALSMLSFYIGARKCLIADYALVMRGL